MHTPDGAPCGLLNHLTAGCKITTDAVPAPDLPAACASLGMVPVMSGGHVLPTVYGVQYIPVFVTPEEQSGGPCPVIYLSTDAARMLREVRHIGTGKTELIGAMEQVYLEIACVEEDIRKGETTHIETSPANRLSLIASLTPFSDFNQSPRNMYQCQVSVRAAGDG